MNRYKYIVSCVLARNYPDLARMALRYIQSKDIPAMRCCVQGYRVQEFEKEMDASIAEEWKEIPHYIPFDQGDTIISVCHNCTNIICETKPDIHVISLYEYILSDPNFVYPDYQGREMTVQDCWRAADHFEEKKAVRTLLERMNIKVREIEDPEDFCGISLLRPQPLRNPRMAPKHYGPQNTVGKFGTYTPAEQAELMREHAKKIPTDDVVCYCHYCLEGLQLSGKNAFHIIELLFRDRLDNLEIDGLN